MPQNMITIASGLPYSLDLVPSEIYLFASVKGMFSGESFEMGKQLLLALEGLFISVEK
jgi:hypothetical protein